MKKFKFFLIVLYAFLIEIATSPLRGYGMGMHICAIVTFLIYFLFINLILRKYSSKMSDIHVLFASIVGCSIIRLPAHTIYFSSALVSLPDFLFHLLGIIMGYLFFKSTKYFKIFIVTFSVVSCIFLYFEGYWMWLSKLNYDTFTGKIEKVEITDFRFQNTESDTLLLNDFRGKIVVVDCWDTHCGVCYEKFPKVQAIYEKYKDNPEIVFFALHSRTENKKENETVKKGREILKDRGYTFPCFSIGIDDPKLKELGVDGYPTVLIFDREGNLIFRGDIRNVEKFVKKILKKEI